MRNKLRILFSAAILLMACPYFAFADAALPPSPVERSAPVAAPAAIIVAAVLIIRTIRNKRR